MTVYQVWIIRTGGFDWELLGFEPTENTARYTIRAFERDRCGLVDWRIVRVEDVAGKGRL